MLDALVHLLLPHTCAACTQQLQHHEELLCLHCQQTLPYTQFHEQPTDNPVSKRLWGRAAVQNASAYLHFTKGGRVQQLVHALKYKNRPDIGQHLGNSYGGQLAQHAAWQHIDWVLPVPLHPAKQRQRGYNQCDGIANGLADALQTRWSNQLLVRQTYTNSQTRKGRFARWLNVETVFAVTDPTILAHKHVLLVDDVITTGATIEACAQQLLAVDGLRLSVACLACANI